MKVLWPRRTWPLRRLAVLWATLLAVALLLAFVTNAVREAEASAWRRALQVAAGEAARVSVVAERLAVSDPSVVSEVLVHAVLQNEVKSGLVADPQMTVVASTSAAEIGLPLAQSHPGLQRLLSERAVGEQLQVLEDRDAGTLQVMRTLPWPREAGQGRAAGRGVMLLQIDVGSRVRELQMRSARSHLVEALVLLFGAGLLFLGLDHLVLRPVARLRVVAERLGDAKADSAAASQTSRGSHVREIDALDHALRRSSTELRATLQRLQDSEQRFRSLTESAPDAIITLDASGKVDQFNAAAERLFGFSAEEMRGRTLEPLLPGDAAQRHARHVEAFEHEREGTSRRMEAGRLVQGRHRDGRILHLEVGISRSRAGQALQFTAVVRDVSDRVAAEAELESYRRGLEELVRRRTVELVHERDRAQVATRAKNEFLARIGHELRTPMNTVLGMAHLLREQPDRAHGARLDALDAAARKLHGLLEDILDFTRLEAGQLALAPAPTPLRPLLQAVVQALPPARRRPEVELVLWIDAGLPEQLVFDGLRLRQVLAHLLDNALKFTAEGHVTLRVSMQGAPSDAALDLRFEVSDSGIGIPADQLERLFEPFEQVDGGDARAQGGAGIGLVICQRVLALMGSELDARSQIGRGSRFGFSLRCPLPPRAGGDAAAVAPPVPGRSGVAGAPLRGRALVVDTLPDSRAALAEALRTLGFVTDTADDRLTALRMLRAAVQRGEPADWVLVGTHRGGAVLTLPADALAQGLAPAPRWLLAAPQATAPALAEVRRCGYLDLIDKPVMVDLLAERLRGTALGDTRAATAPPPRASPVSSPPAPPAEPGLVPLPARLQPLEKVTGLDPRRGMSAVLDNADAYLRLLETFARFHAGDPAQLREAVAKGDVQALRARAHSLKSTTAAVGAAGLQALAHQLAHQGLALDAPAKTAAAELADGLQALLEALEPHLAGLQAPSPDAAGGAPPVAANAAARVMLAPQVQAARDRLRRSLQQRDLATLRWLQDTSDAELAGLGVPAAALRHAVQAFDYDAALRLLDGADAPQNP